MSDRRGDGANMTVTWMSVLQGFYTKVVPSKRNKNKHFHEEEAIAMSFRAATTFTLGFRSFYAFIPLVSIQYNCSHQTFPNLIMSASGDKQKQCNASCWACRLLFNY